MRSLAFLCASFCLCLALGAAAGLPKGGPSRLQAKPPSKETVGHLMSGMNMDFSKSLVQLGKGVVCLACKETIDFLVTIFESGLTAPEIIAEVVAFCHTLGVFTDAECEGAINNYAPELLYMAGEGRMSGGRACPILLGTECSDFETVNDWNVEVPAGKPPVIPPMLPPEGAITSKFLHLSDIHLDATYTVGSTAVECGQILCCSNATSMSPPAGHETRFWGGYRCDLPAWTFQDMLNHIRETHTDLSYIILTGDYPAHDIWLQGKELNLGITTAGYNMVRQVFPDIPIYSSIGNHESFPCNSFPTSRNISSELFNSWMYEGLADLYSTFLSAEAEATLRQNGFYSTLVQPGFRIIAINSNMCYTANFWLNYEFVDPFGQLSWLSAELLKAEANNEIVHILSHIPAGHGDCLGSWGREFARIIERFENTVVNQFYGHTHNDEYFVIYDEATNSRAVNVGFITPSVTTWQNLNPAYRIYTMDGFYPGSSMRVLDYETFIFNVSLANTIGESERPQYYKLYDARPDLEMQSLFPADFDDLARRLATDDLLWDKYLRYYGQDVPDDYSRREVVCGMITSNNLDDRKCLEVMGPEKII